MKERVRMRKVLELYLNLFILLFPEVFILYKIIIKCCCGSNKKTGMVKLSVGLNGCGYVVRIGDRVSVIDRVKRNDMKTKNDATI